MAASLLSPVGAVYGQVARVLYERGTPYRCRLPVVCVGNFTAGGTGKTPLALYICQHLNVSGMSRSRSRVATAAASRAPIG